MFNNALSFETKSIVESEYKKLLSQKYCFTCKNNGDSYNRRIRIIGCEKHRKKYGTKTQSFSCQDYVKSEKEMTL